MDKLAVQSRPLRTRAPSDKVAALLQSEAILPTQFWDDIVDQRGAPERRLLLAVLEDALITILQYRHRDDLISRRLVTETEKWIASERRTSIFDFAGLCDTLGIHPSYIRDLLKRLPTLFSAKRRRSHSGRGHHKVRASGRRRRK